MPRFAEHEDVEAGWAGAGGEEAPLVGKRVGRHSPVFGQETDTNCMQEEDIDAAMQGEDNVSVLSGGADPALQHQTDETLHKSLESTHRASFTEDAKKAVAEPVKGADGGQQGDWTSRWWVAPVCVALFISFDAGKAIANRTVLHGSTVSGAINTNVIQLVNLLLAFVFTLIFMGPKGGVSAMFDWKRLSAYALPSAMFALGQVLQMVQLQFISSSTQKVFSQLRIPLTALFSVIVLRAGYSPLQWGMISGITAAVIQFELLQKPEDLFGDPDGQIFQGFVLSLLASTAAVLGSIFGEKAMKESRALPIYLQKFQADLWTLLFGVFATFFLVPVLAVVLDLCDGHKESVWTGPLFEKNWPLAYRAAIYTSKEALTDWKYEAKYAKYASTSAGLLQEREEVTVTIPNRMDMAYWTTASDMRSAGTQYGVALGSTLETFNSYEQFNKLHRVMAKRRSATPNTELKTVEDRTRFVNRGLAKDFGRMPGHSPSQLREVGGGSEALLVDTGFYVTQPFSVSTPSGLKSKLTDNFVMTLGPKVDASAMFEPFFLFKRDAPQGDAEVMRKSPVTNHFASGANKNTGLPKPVSYFTLTQDYRLRSAQDVIDLARELKPTESLKAPSENYTPALQALLGDVYYTAADVDFSGDTSEDTRQGAAVKEAFAKFGRGDRLPFAASQKFEYKKAQYYIGTDSDVDPRSSEILKGKEHRLLIAYIRTTTLTLEALNGDDANQATSFSKSVDERVVFKVSGCDGALHFEDENFAAKETTCGKMEAVEGVKPGKFSLAFAENKPEKDADPKQGETKSEKRKKETAEKDAWAAFDGEEQKRQLMTKWEATLFGDGSPLAELNGAHFPFFSQLAFGKPQDLLASNELTMFKNSPVLSTTQAVEDLKMFPGDHENIGAVAVQTYPGGNAGGVSGGCTADLCNVSEGEWSSNFEYFRSVILGARSFRMMRPEEIDLSRPENIVYGRHAFQFAELHPYTRSPLPAAFVTFSFFVMIFLNVAQQWTSTYISKALSSLTKSLCQAVALVLVVLPEKVLLEDTIGQLRNDWARIVFGMLGVILTVLVFQMSPKPEKKH